MGPLIVSVVVVVVSGMLVGKWLAMGGGTVEPATGRPGSASAPRARGPVLVDGGTPWWRRVRSAAALGCLSVVLGVLVAAGVGVVLFLLFTLLRASVG